MEISRLRYYGSLGSHVVDIRYKVGGTENSKDWRYEASVNLPRHLLYICQPHESLLNRYYKSKIFTIPKDWNNLSNPTSLIYLARPANQIHQSTPNSK